MTIVYGVHFLAVSVLQGFSLLLTLKEFLHVTSLAYGHHGSVLELVIIGYLGIMLFPSPRLKARDAALVHLPFSNLG